MYTSWFGLIKKPFNLTSEPLYLFLSPCHREALYFVLDGINERKALIIITGDAGTGKTILCRALSSYLDTSIESAFLFHPMTSDLEFLKTVNEKFGINIEDSESKTKKDYFEALNNFLLKIYDQGGKAVLVIDEAQSLSYKVLKQIWKLSKLATNKEKLIHIVLVGHPELKDVLAAPPLRLVDGHSKVYYDLKPLDSKFLKGYVKHRLQVVGNKENLQFTNQAFKRIHSYSQGNPIQINNVCDLALSIAYRERKYKISNSIIEKAIKELKGDLSVSLQNIDRPWIRFAPITTILLLIFIVTSFYGLSLKENILKPFSLEKNNVVLKIDKNRNTQLAAFMPKNKVTLPIRREISEPILIEPAVNEPASNKESFETEVSSKRKTFSVQIGAFLSRKNAENLAENLKRKGYAPYIFEASDYVKRKWYAVRMMSFNNFKDAYIMALEFTRKEQKPAIVTAVDSLEPVRPVRNELGIVSWSGFKKRG